MPAAKIKVKSVPEFIEEIGEAAPDSIAVSHGGRETSFRQLNAMADSFTCRLQKLGVARGSTVAICMERSTEWIAAALAILRAGAAYVPLDDNWPDARLRFSVEDSGADVLFAPMGFSERLGVSVPTIDPAVSSPGTYRSRPVPVDSGDVAYVIYTSGSTGVPKGVEVTHANLIHLVRWHREAFEVTSRDRASHLAGLGFDAAVWEIWPNLCAGATLCLASEMTRSAPELIQEWLVLDRITVTFVPTLHAIPLLGMQWPKSTALRFMLTGGDRLHEAPPASLPFKTVNNYGPTECTVVTTTGVVPPGSTGTPPIGRAIAGAAVYLLDESGYPVADGAIGEIYIGGEGVARGYRNLPAQTQRSFLYDPFAKTASGRMYRTGDFGMRRPDGEIEFRGRRDRQVKLRGQRVELDEIDSLLSRHPNLAFAATLCRGEERKAHLVSYVVPRGESTELTVQSLQQYLKRSLPASMVPAVFVLIDSIPISSNGKLDLSRLPSPKDEVLLGRSSIGTTVSPLEERLLQIVRQLLKDSSIGRNDNFFLAGGHSLLGMQFITRIQKSFNVDMSYRDLFQAPTVQGLAVLLQQRLDEISLAEMWQDQLGFNQTRPDNDLVAPGADQKDHAIVRQRIAAKFGKRISAEQFSMLPTVRGQARLLEPDTCSTLPSGVLEVLPKAGHKLIFWVHYQNVELARAIGDEMTFLSVVLTPEDLQTLSEAPTLQQIARRLVPKILKTQPEGPYVIGGLCIGGVLAYEVAHQLKTAGHEVSLLVLLDPPTPAYLKLGPTPAVDLPYVRYVLQRAIRLGPRVSAKYFRERFARRLGEIVNKASRRTPESAAQKITEGASFNYSPAQYHGKVLLLLASERPPNVNFLPGWQAVVTTGLNAQYVNGHHRDLLGSKTVQDIADAIKSRLLLS